MAEAFEESFGQHVIELGNGWKIQCNDEWGFEWGLYSKEASYCLAWISRTSRNIEFFSAKDWPASNTKRKILASPRGKHYLQILQNTMEKMSPK